MRNSRSFGASGIQLRKYLRGAVPLDPLVVRDEERDERERERDRERARRGVDPPRRDVVPRLAGQRQRDEAEQVDHEDEEQQGRDVREPAAERLRRQPLLRDLILRELVQRLADRLALARQQGEPAPHREDPERARQDGAEHEIRDRLRDRQVDRADVDRDPRVLLELRRRVEVPRRRGRNGDERENCDDEKCPQPRQRAGLPKYELSEKPSSNVYARPYVSAAVSATSWLFESAANSTTSSASDLEEEPERLHPGVRDAAVLVVPKSGEQEVDAVQTEPEHRGEPPAGDVPAEDQEDRQEEQEDDRPAGRRQQVVRLVARRGEDRAQHQTL